MSGAPANEPGGTSSLRAREDLNRIAAYLARRDVPGLATADGVRADVLVLCGSAVLRAVDTAAAAVHDGVVERLLVTGGTGHSTEHLREAVRADPRYRDVATHGRSEAAILAQVLRDHHAVPRSALAVEERSTNCGENAELSVDLLLRAPAPPRSILLVQDPTMQRRTHASFERHLRGAAPVTVRSHAPFVPAVAEGGGRCVTDDVGRAVWSLERFTALVLGEVRRLNDDEHGYGPHGAGFIGHVDVPDGVLAAYRRLSAAAPGSPRAAWQPGARDR